jgi:hypothetical protein
MVRAMNKITKTDQPIDRKGLLSVVRTAKFCTMAQFRENTGL